MKSSKIPSSKIELVIPNSDNKNKRANSDGFTAQATQRLPITSRLGPSKITSFPPLE